MKKSKEEGNAVKLIKDKLFINGQPYRGPQSENDESKMGQTCKTKHQYKLEYGKQEKTYPTIENFEPRTRKPDPSTLCRKLRDGLQNVCSSAVALPVLPRTNNTALLQHCDSSLFWLYSV